MSLVHTRQGLIRLCFALSGYECNREIDSTTRLRKEEFAVIVLALDPSLDSPAHSNL